MPQMHSFNLPFWISEVIDGKFLAIGSIILTVSGDPSPNGNKLYIIFIFIHQRMVERIIVYTKHNVALEAVDTFGLVKTVKRILLTIWRISIISI